MDLDGMSLRQSHHKHRRKPRNEVAQTIMTAFAFLSLPPEIRLHIYRHYFHHCPAYLSLDNPVPDTLRRAPELRILAGSEGALFLTCRQVFQESRLVFFDQAIYCLDRRNQLCRIPYFIREQHYEGIKRFMGTWAECEALTDAVLGWGRSGDLTSLIALQITESWELGRESADDAFVILLRKLAMCKKGLKVYLHAGYVDSNVHELLGSAFLEAEQITPLLRTRSKSLAGNEDGWANRSALQQIDDRYYDLISSWRVRHLPKVPMALAHVNQRTISAFNRLLADMIKDVFRLVGLKIKLDVNYMGQRKPVVCEYARWWDEAYDSVHEAEEGWRRKKEAEELNRRIADKTFNSMAIDNILNG